MIWAIDIMFRHICMYSLEKKLHTTAYMLHIRTTTFNQNPSHIFNQTMNKGSGGYNLENIKCSIKPE